MPKFSGGVAPWTPTGALSLEPAGGCRALDPSQAPQRRASRAAAVASMAAWLAALANPICSSEELACSSGTLAGMGYYT